MRVAITGADGFVGRHLVDAVRAAGHAVVAARRAGTRAPAWSAADVEWRTLELTDMQSVAEFAALDVDAVIHLAALASGREAREDPGLAWTINAAGSARLLEALASRASAPRVILVSTGEVYGAGPAVPRVEVEDPRPMSPYAASKLGAEVAALEVHRRTGLPVVIARPFAHTGPGQLPIYVAPAFAQRLRDVKQHNQRSMVVGNLAPVRDFLDVRDVAAAYVSLLAAGSPGQIYNVASGRGVSLRDLFEHLADLVDAHPELVADPALMRAADLPHLVGDPTKLHAATGWRPAISFTQTLQDLVDAQAH